MDSAEVGAADVELEVANKDSLRAEDEEADTVGSCSSCKAVEGETLR